MMRQLWDYFFGPCTPGSTGWRRAHGAVLIVLCGVLAAVYFTGSLEAARQMNKDPAKHDQRRFIGQARMLRWHPVDYVTPRQWMPGYPALLAPFRVDEEDMPAFLRRMQPWSVGFSLLALAGLAGVLRRHLPWAESVLLTLLAAWTLFIFRGGHLQPELIFFVLFLASLLLMLELLRRPSWRLAAWTGAAFAAAQYFKAAMLPALGLLGACWAVKCGVQWLRERRTPGWPQRLSRLAGIGLVVPAVLLFYLLPYLLASKRTFGSFFFNAHTAYHMWCDTPEESDALNFLEADRLPVNLQPYALAPHYAEAARLGDDPHRYDALIEKWRHTGLPSASRALNEHTRKQLWARVRSGFLQKCGRLWRDYAPLLLSMAVAAGLALLLAFARPRAAWQLGKTHALGLLAGAGFIGGYLLSYSWYAALGMGPRLFLNLALPLLVLPALAAWRLAEGAEIPLGPLRLSVRKLINLALAITLVLAVRQVWTTDLHRVVGGQ